MCIFTQYILKQKFIYIKYLSYHLACVIDLFLYTIIYKNGDWNKYEY